MTEAISKGIPRTFYARIGHSPAAAPVALIPRQGPAGYRGPAESEQCSGTGGRTGDGQLIREPGGLLSVRPVLPDRAGRLAAGPDRAGRAAGRGGPGWPGSGGRNHRGRDRHAREVIVAPLMPDLARCRRERHAGSCISRRADAGLPVTDAAVPWGKGERRRADLDRSGPSAGGHRGRRRYRRRAVPAARAGEAERVPAPPLRPSRPETFRCPDPNCWSVPSRWWSRRC